MAPNNDFNPTAFSTNERTAPTPAAISSTPTNPDTFDPVQFAQTAIHSQPAPQPASDTPTPDQSGFHPLSAIKNTFVSGINSVKEGFQNLYSTPNMDGEAERQAIAGGGLPAGIAEGGAQVARAGVEGVKNLGKIVGGIGQAALSPILGPAGAAGTAIGNELGQQVPDQAGQTIDKAASNPVVAQTTDDVAQLSNLALPEISKGTNTAITATTDAGKNIAAKTTDTVTKATNAVADKTINPAVKPLQSAISRANVPDNLQASVDRLNAQKPDVAIGVKPQSPLDLYNQYVDQESKFKNDIKEDTALGTVGNKDLGPAFDQVVKMRQAAGKQMQSEMDKVGSTPTDISEHFPKFEEELHNNGLTYDASKGELSAGRTSKVTTQDKDMLETYIGDLNKLGTNPTAAELDAFLSRVPKELNVYKSANNITGTTNGERIIKGNLNDLSSTLSGDTNPTFKGYSDAKSQYAKLSKFLDDGSSFVGQKTASGDYSKDASMLKSSIQSILNNGKKDWLLKLEDLTGKPILDKAMLALQAMKDSGDFRANSLLDLLTPKQGPSIPTSKSGIIDRATTAAYNFGKQKIAGSPVDQTRRFIQDRLSTPK